MAAPLLLASPSTSQDSATSHATMATVLRGLASAPRTARRCRARRLQRQDAPLPVSLTAILASVVLIVPTATVRRRHAEQAVRATSQYPCSSLSWFFFFSINILFRLVVHRKGFRTCLVLRKYSSHRPNLLSKPFYWRTVIQCPSEGCIVLAVHSDCCCNNSEYCHSLEKALEAVRADAPTINR